MNARQVSKRTRTKIESNSPTNLQETNKTALRNSDKYKLVLCADKYLNLLNAEQVNMLEHYSSITLNELKAKFSSLSIKTTEINFLHKPTIIKAPIQNSEVTIKFVYKFKEYLTIIKKKIESLMSEMSTCENKEENNKSALRSKYLETKAKEIEEMLQNERNAFKRHKHMLRVNWYGELTYHNVFISELCPHLDLARFTSDFPVFFSRHFSSNLNLPWLNSMSETLLAFFISQILSALQVFRKTRLIHGNLTPDNILITQNYNLKITDFACSKVPKNSDIFKISKNELEVKTEYQPPEYFRQDNFVNYSDAHKIDIFSVGCCLFKMATNRDLFSENITRRESSEENNKEIDYIGNIIKNTRRLSDLINNKEITSNVKISKNKRSSEFVKFLEGMLEPFEKGRISIGELICHDWLTSHRSDIKKIQDTFTNEKMILEMMKREYLSIDKQSKEDIPDNKYTTVYYKIKPKFIEPRQKVRKRLEIFDVNSNKCVDYVFIPET